MKKLALLLVCLPFLAQAGIVKNELELEFETVEIPTPPHIIKQIEFNLAHRDGAPPLLDGFADIINLGRTLWKIVESGKATLEAKNSYASAVPGNVKSAGELAEFSPLQFKSFAQRATSWYYGTAFEITYTLAHKYNGSLNGNGRYLDSVTVVPHKVNVSWAYGLNVSVDKISVSNVGSHANPVGSVVMDFNLRVTSWFKSSQYKNLYEFRGDSAVVRSIED